MAGNEEARALANKHAGTKSLPQWMERALSGESRQNKDGTRSSIRSVDFGADGKFYIAPRIRKVGGKLIELSKADAVKRAIEKGDAFGPFETNKDATDFSVSFSKALRPTGRASDILTPERR